MSFAALGVAGTIAAVGTAGSLAMGGVQMANANRQQKRAQAELERQAANSPLRKESKSLNDYYQQALNRYQESPYQSAAYQQAMQNARRTTASGLSALKANEDELFDINVMTPYQRKLQLEQMKGAAAGERYNAGMQMVGQGLSNALSYATYMDNPVKPPVVDQQPDLRQVMADARSAKLNQSYIPQNNSRIRTTGRNIPTLTAKLRNTNG